MKTHTATMKLVFYQEDNMVGAYLPLPSDPDDEICIGKIHVAHYDNPRLQQAFMSLMKACIIHSAQASGATSVEFGGLNVVHPDGGNA